MIFATQRKAFFDSYASNHKLSNLCFVTQGNILVFEVWIFFWWHKSNVEMFQLLWGIFPHCRNHPKFCELRVKWMLLVIYQTSLQICRMIYSFPSGEIFREAIYFWTCVVIIFFLIFVIKWKLQTCWNFTNSFFLMLFHD